VTKKTTKKKVTKKKINIVKDLPAQPVAMVPRESFDRLAAIHKELIERITEHYTALERLMVHSITSIESMRAILKGETSDDDPEPNSNIGKGYPGFKDTP
jgi:hypothetical protein